MNDDKYPMILIPTCKCCSHFEIISDYLNAVFISRERPHNAARVACAAAHVWCGSTMFDVLKYHSGSYMLKMQIENRASKNV